ncbi:MAG: chromosomal replication initiator protein DnaA [Tannerella sp.]|jgi:chromosomal replication initiator protein|nr:chromosomal replication initiator protein DnaA [Tannerella sp.]
MQANYLSLWNKCLEIIKDILPEAAYRTWFLPIVPISYENKKFTIQVPSQFFYEYLEEKYVHVLKVTLFRIFGEGVILNYRIVMEKSGKDSTIDYPATNSHAVLSTPSPIDIKKAPQPYTGYASQDLDSLLNPKYTIDNFFEGTSNKLARRAGETIADNPGRTTFNPLLLYGHSGVGKTHLCHAIGLRTREMHPAKKVLYVSASVFQTQYTDAVRKNTTNDFLMFYQSLDVLILDDIHELVGKQHTQNTFFHIFNNLHQLGKQLVMTSDKAPAEIRGMEERLITRLKWGLTTEIAQPDKALRKKILQKKIEAEGLVFKSDVCDYIAEHVTDNIRDLEGTLVSLMAHSVINNREIDITLTRQIIKQIVSAKQEESLSIEKIQKVVCDFFHLEPELIHSPSRKREIVQARQIVMYLAIKHMHVSLSHIGRRIGGKNHATVSHSCNAVRDLIETDKTFRSTMETLEDTLKKPKLA